MKNIYTYIIVILALVAGNVNGQIVTTKTDTIRLYNDTLLLKTGIFRGEIQWQHSSDSVQWFNIDDENSDTLLFELIDSVGLYRAKIVDGTCLPVFSDTVSIRFASPIVSTYSADSIDADSAFLHGAIVDDGGTNIFEKGFCWSAEDTIPDSTSNVIIVENNSLIFDTTLYELEPNSIYYTRAYAINSIGISYGEIDTFITLVQTPTVYTNDVTNISSGSAKLNGKIVNSGGSDITQLGFYWSATNETPDANDNINIAESNNVDFYATISVLLPNTTYYVSAYAINSKGTAIGNVVNFTINANTPSESTYNASDVTTNSATLSGEVTDDGGATVTNRGFYWSATDKTPDHGDNVETAGSGTGSFSKSISGLQPGTTYYFRSYATNSAGTAMGQVKSFTTLANLPSVNTLAATDIASESATLNGEVTNNEGSEVTAHGFYWSETDETPDNDDNVETSGTGTGSFSKSISGLQPGTTYYVRAFATNSAGTVTGEVESFTTPANPPSVNTLAATDIASESATLNGEVTNNGGSEVTAHGFYWSETDETPDNDDNVETSGTGTGSFSKSISGLQPVITYYIRAFATNSAGTAMGQVKSFTTLANLPTVNTMVATDVTAESATLRGEITGNGGAEVTERGFYWNNTGETPDSDDNVETSGTGIGSYSKAISSLQSNTTYYFRAYATNSSGTAIGNMESFTTESGIVTDSRDGNTYNWVEIGEQVWMSENLKYLPKVDSSIIGSNTEPYFYVYDYQGTSVSAAKATNNYSTYGVLYNWSAAKAACPSGWHLPTDAEWKQMEMYIGMSQSEADDSGWRGIYEGKKLKATNGWSGNGNGTDDYVFLGLPGGFRFYHGNFSDIANCGLWWSSTEGSSSRAWNRALYHDYTNINRNDNYKKAGFSVRCVRD